MYEKGRAKKSFDHCQVRAAVNLNTHSRSISMVCAKYPSGFDVGTSDIEYSDQRKVLALTLGCLTCPYRKSELEVGESAVEGIKRLSSQVSIDLMNAQFNRPDAPEPPQLPANS